MSHDGLGQEGSDRYELRRFEGVPLPKIIFFLAVSQIGNFSI